MKIKNIIAGIALSATLVGGILTGVVANKNVEVKETQAATTYWNQGDVIYVRLYSGFFDASATAYANYPDGNGTWHSEKITTSVTTKGSETLYKYTFSYAAQSFQILRKNSSGSDQWGYTDSHTSHSTNLFEVTGYGSGQYMNSNFASASVVNVTLTQPAAGGTIAVKNKNGSQSGAGYYYSDWTLQFTATPSTGYFFGNWTDGSGTDWQGSDKYNNPVELTNLSGNFGVSCKFTAYSSQVWKVLGDSSGTWDAQHQDIEVTLPYKTGSAESGGAEYYTQTLTLVEGAVFKVVNMNVQPNVYYGYDCLETGEHSAKGTYVVADGTGTDVNIKVAVAGTYELYMKASTGKIWMQISSQDEAIAYGGEFLSLITCNSDSVSFQIDAWNKVGSATTSAEYKFEHLTSGARSYLASLQPNESGNDAEKAVARYDRILGKYGYGTASGQYHDFMGRTPARLSANVRPFFNSTNNDGSNVVVIVIISAFAVTAIGGYFFLRHRKEN